MPVRGAATKESATITSEPDLPLNDSLAAKLAWVMNQAGYVQKRGWNEPRTMTYTLDDAKKAGLVQQNPNYISRPPEMMIARASALAAQTYFPSVCLGLDVEDIAGKPDAPILTATVVAEEKPPTLLESMVQKVTAPPFAELPDRAARPEMVIHAE